MTHETLKITDAEAKRFLARITELRKRVRDYETWLCTAPDCLDQRLASGCLLGNPSLARLVGCASA
jgi:hypothetical protein